MKRRQGIVLVLTVVLIGFATAAMVRLANRSLSAIARGTIALEELQQRWAIVGCRLSMLSRAEEIFQSQEEEIEARGLGWPLPNDLQLTFMLNNEPLRILLRDEQARVNINVMYDKHPPQLASAIARSIASSSVHLHLQPIPEVRGRAAQRFVSWGQIVDLSQVDGQRPIQELLVPLTSTFTCWGDGKVNLRRASDEALRLAVKEILNPVEANELLTLRRGYQGSVESLLSSVDVHRRTQLRLNQVLREESQCYSLLLSRPARDFQRVTHIVHDPSNRTNSPIRVFQW